MAIKTFYLDHESLESIVLKWGFNWRNFTVTKEGEVIGFFKNEKELKHGQSFLLAEDKVLSIQLKRKYGYIPELEILLNGSPIPGSGTEPQEQLKQVYNLLLFIAILNAGVGLLTELTGLEFLQKLGFGFETIIVGLLFGLFAYLVHYKRSLIALYFSIGLFGLDILLTFAFAAELGSNPTSGVVMKGMFIMLLCNGVKALKKVKGEALLLSESNI